MQLILIRHAKAFDRDPLRWPDDARRPLADDGARDFRRLAKRLGRILPSVERVESSSFERAWATAAILHGHAGWPRPARSVLLEPGSSADEVEGAGRRASEPDPMQPFARAVAAMQGGRAVVWVGHEPILSRVASLFLAGSPDAVRIDLAKGAALALSFGAHGDAPVIGRAELLWMLTPRMVRRMR